MILAWSQQDTSGNKWKLIAQEVVLAEMQVRKIKTDLAPSGYCCLVACISWNFALDPTNVLNYYYRKCLKSKTRFVTCLYDINMKNVKISCHETAKEVPGNISAVFKAVISGTHLFLQGVNFKREKRKVILTKQVEGGDVLLNAINSF